MAGRSACVGPTFRTLQLRSAALELGKDCRIGGNALPRAPIPMRSVGHRVYHPCRDRGTHDGPGSAGRPERALALCARAHTNAATARTSAAGTEELARA